jgi:protein-tyrosine phosphatase
MIDIHCHILSDSDDGPKSFAECLAMVDAAVSAGVSHIIATPHHMNGAYENPKKRILERVSDLNQYLLKEKVPLTICPGQELRIHREIFQSLEKDEILTIDNKGLYLLLELPSNEIPIYTQEVVYELQLKGIIPIIVHPERNRECIKDPNRLVELVKEGALTQLTAGSVLGQFGNKIKSFSEKMIEHQLAHFISSDAHNIDSRGFILKEAYEAIADKFGQNQTDYFRENTDLLITRQHIDKRNPVKIKKNLGHFLRGLLL